MPLAASAAQAQIVRVFFVWIIRMRTFDKPAIDVHDQINLLKERGLQFQDEVRAGRFLEVVSYFRLTPYMRPFQHSSDCLHSFRPGTGFRDLTRLYDFDRRLRLLTMDAVERIEVAARTAISNHMGVKYGSHWYLDQIRFQSRYQHHKLLSSIEEKQNRSGNSSSLESYAAHYSAAYQNPKLMPGWAMIEELTFGELSYLFSGLAQNSDQKMIARRLSIVVPTMKSWLHTLTTVRNICAHHARLWNRELGVSPVLPKVTDSLWVKHNSDKPRRIYTVLCILGYLMRLVSPNTSWDFRLLELLNEFPEVDRAAMGFPKSWKDDPFWLAHKH